MWDTRYRPLVFADVLGQEGSVRVLRARLLKGEAFDTSYIFAGGHGSGKTTLARILARAMLCLQPRQDGDPCNVCEHCQACLSETMNAFTELDAASQGTTADMRRIVDNLAYDIPGIKKRIYLLDEAHRMSRDAQDCLLKPIEDRRVVVLFCTTEYGKIRDTIKSRCETYEIRRIQKEDILGRVQRILTEEGVAFEDDAILTVIDYARGHVRDILNKLETIAQLGAITVEAVRQGLDLAVVSLYYDILLALGDAPKAVELIEDACDRVGAVQVATGIAEAAMNAYRQANQIYTDYSQLDRERAALVYARYGATTVNVARYFLGLGGYVTKIDLVCAAVVFDASDTQAVASPRLLSPPVVFAKPAVGVVTVEPSGLPAQAPAAPVRAAPVSLGAVSPAPVSPAPVPPAAISSTVVSPAAVSAPVKVYLDGNIPTCPEDEAAMSGEPPKGVGPATSVYRAKVPSSRPPPVEQLPSFNRQQFTAQFNEMCKSQSQHVT